MVKSTELFYQFPLKSYEHFSFKNKIKSLYISQRYHKGLISKDDFGKAFLFIFILCSLLHMRHNLFITVKVFVSRLFLRELNTSSCGAFLHLCADYFKVRICYTLYWTISLTFLVFPDFLIDWKMKNIS